MTGQRGQRGQRVVGVDSSTQSCKVVVCDADTGEVLAEGRADHPGGTEVDPHVWWSALQQATGGDGAPGGGSGSGSDDAEFGDLLDGVAAISVAGQQHGMVALDPDGAVVRDALLWNDLRSAPDAADLVAELGAEQWAEATGSVPGASFTVTKLRWMARVEPQNAARTAQVLLPHDWLTRQLAGGATARAVTDRGDASGTGYFSPAENRYRAELVERALGLQPQLPDVLGPAEVAGTLAGSDTLLAPGTGDNMAAALGLGAAAGDVVLSLGTSGTVFAVADTPTADPSGNVAGFADATGAFLPLVCTLNAARVLTATAAMLGTDVAGLDALALQAEPGAGGITLLPYLDGERTPNLPDAAGSLHGLTRNSMTPQNIARAAVEGMLCGLADGLDALVRAGRPGAQAFQVKRVIVIGGASASRAVRELTSALFGADVVVPAPGEYVALGAARQAAWVLAGANGGASASPPPWSVPTTGLPSPSAELLERGREVRDRYAQLRRAVHGV